MAFATSKIIACVCAFCAAEMAGELFRKLSENLPIEGACPRLWCRAEMAGEIEMPLEVRTQEAICKQALVTQ